jgi:hypothetical protein
MCCCLQVVIEVEALESGQALDITGKVRALSLTAWYVSFTYQLL